MNNKQIMKYIYAFSMGDGCLVKKSKNAMFQATQLAKNSDYIYWRANVLSELTTINHRSFIHTSGNEMLVTETKTHSKSQL